jgi:multisubunit Na+/H+ antiporter MnhG subunit
MSNSSRTAAFFNRSHFVKGAQSLAMIFCMLGVIFVVLDSQGLGVIRPTTLIWLGAGVLLSALAAVVSHRARAGVTPLVTGCALGFLYLGTTWFSTLSRS